MANDISYSPPPPTPKQQRFLLADSRYVAYGGARGGGKSHAVRLKAALLALTYAGIRIIIIRRTYPELLENHIRKLSAELSGVAVYKEVDKSLTFPNGSRIVFGYCATESDVLRYQGQEYDILMIDEATQLTEYQFTWLDAMVRGVNDFPKRTYLTCNPGGVGHDYIKRRFVKGNNPDTVFIQASVYDNPALMESDPDYVRMLKELPDGLRQAWLDGDWDYFVGQYFTAFRTDIHVIEPIEISKHWRRYRAIDYGLDMLACLWIAVSPQNECYVYREFCQPELIASDAAQGIISRQEKDEDIYLTYAPPDLWSRTKDSGKSIFELFRDNGVAFVKSDAARVPGWLAVAEWLKHVTGADGKETARLHIFSTCTELIRCLPLLQHDTKNPSDCATEPHDITHVCDALRYFCVMRQAAPKELDMRTEQGRRIERDFERAVFGKSTGKRRSRF